MAFLNSNMASIAIYSQFTGVLWIALLNLPVSMSNNSNVTIALKQTFEKDNKYIAEDTDDFREFLLKSSAYVDKTMLIRELLNITLDRVLTLNYPHKWGKSLNLNMIKTFLEIEVDIKGNRVLPHYHSRNYRLFKKGEIISNEGEVHKLKKPLLIGEDDYMMEKYQGKRPVIYLNLSSLNPGNCFNDLHNDLLNRISDCFTDHQYMKEVFYDILEDTSLPEMKKDQARKDLEKYKRILWKKGTILELQRSLHFLSKILTEHFRVKPFILVDGYDAPFNNTLLSSSYPKSHQKTFLDFYDKFNFFTFIVNDDFEKGILTGVIPLARGNLLLGLNSITELTLLRNTDVHKYYGFNREEVDYLFRLFDVDDNTTKKAYQYYESYRIGTKMKLKLIQPSPIVHLINTKELQRSDASFLDRYLSVDSIRLAFNSLLSGLQIPLPFTNLTFNAEDFHNIQNASYYNEKFYGPIVKSFLKYIYTSGHITLTEIIFGDRICSRFSNGELYATLGGALVNYYEKQFPCSTDQVIHLCTRFRGEFEEFVKSDEPLSPKLSHTLSEFFSYIFRPRGFITNENEDMTHLVMDFLTIFLNTLKRYPSYGTEILLFGKDIGIIVESTFGKSSAAEALEKAQKSLPKFEPLQFPRMKFIGVNAKPNASIDVLGAST